jgi:hypothetical protein
MALPDVLRRAIPANRKGVPASRNQLNRSEGLPEGFSRRFIASGDEIDTRLDLSLMRPSRRCAKNFFSEWTIACAEVGY